MKEDIYLRNASCITQSIAEQDTTASNLAATTPWKLHVSQKDKRNAVSIDLQRQSNTNTMANEKRP